MTKLLLLATLIISNLLFSQVTFEKNRLIKDGKSYKLSQYDEVFQNSEAKTFVKKARTNNTIGQIFAGVGGGVMGFGIARALSGGKTEIIDAYGQPQTIKQDKSGAWAAVGIGAGIIAIGIPFAISAGKNLKKGLAVENGEENNAGYFKFEAGGNGLALSYNF